MTKTKEKRAKEQRTFRDSKRAKGYVLKQIWVKPENWGRIQKYLKRYE